MRRPLRGVRRAPPKEVLPPRTVASAAMSRYHQYGAVVEYTLSDGTVQSVVLSLAQRLFVGGESVQLVSVPCVGYTGLPVVYFSSRGTERMVPWKSLVPWKSFPEEEDIRF